MITINPLPLNKNNQNINTDFDDAEKTKKKDFESKIIPYQEVRKDQKLNSLWIATYDDLMSKKYLLEILKKCENSSIPSEWIAIHLKNYKVYFGESNLLSNESSTAFICESNDNICFLKLYLINKNQLSDIYNIAYKTSKFDINLLSIEENSKIHFDKTNSYGCLMHLGKLENIDILTATSINLKLLKSPQVDYLKIIYTSLKKAFYPYSSYLIIYYLYRLDGIKTFYSINNLLNVFFSSKISNKEDTSIYEDNNDIYEENNSFNYVNILDKEVKNYIDSTNDNIKNFDKINDDKTLICPTCNLSPNLESNRYSKNLNRNDFNINELTSKHFTNKFSQVLDLKQLPVYDSKTGEFSWKNYNIDNNNLKNHKCHHYSNSKSFDIRNGSIISLSSSMMEKDEDYTPIATVNSNVNNYNNLNLNNKQPYDFMEELNNVLKKLDL